MNLTSHFVWDFLDDIIFYQGPHSLYKHFKGMFMGINEIGENVVSLEDLFKELIL